MFALHIFLTHSSRTDDGFIFELSTWFLQWCVPQESPDITAYICWEAQRPSPPFFPCCVSSHLPIQHHLPPIMRLPSFPFTDPLSLQSPPPPTHPLPQLWCYSHPAPPSHCSFTFLLLTSLYLTLHLSLPPWGQWLGDDSLKKKKSGEIRKERAVEIGRDSRKNVWEENGGLIIRLQWVCSCHITWRDNIGIFWDLY